MYNGARGRKPGHDLLDRGATTSARVEEINYFFRDWRDNRVHRIDQRNDRHRSRRSHRLMETDEPYTLLSALSQTGQQQPAAQPVLRCRAQLQPPARRGGGTFSFESRSVGQMYQAARGLQSRRGRPLLPVELRPYGIVDRFAPGVVYRRHRGNVPSDLAPGTLRGVFLFAATWLPRWTSPNKSPHMVAGPTGVLRDETYTKRPRWHRPLTPEQLSPHPVGRDGTCRARESTLTTRNRGSTWNVVWGGRYYRLVDKYESGCRLPCYRHAVTPAHVVQNLDLSLGMIRTEVRSHPRRQAIGGTSFSTARATGAAALCINSALAPLRPSRQLGGRGYGDISDQVEDITWSTTRERAVLRAAVSGHAGADPPQARRHLDPRGYTGGDVPHATYRNHGTHAEGSRSSSTPR